MPSPSAFLRSHPLLTLLLLPTLLILLIYSLYSPSTSYISPNGSPHNGMGELSFGNEDVGAGGGGGVGGGDGWDWVDEGSVGGKQAGWDGVREGEGEGDARLGEMEEDWSIIQEGDDSGHNHGHHRPTHAHAQEDWQIIQEEQAQDQDQAQDHPSHQLQGAEQGENWSWIEESIIDKGRKVDLDLAVMSRCPDARICEATMDKVLREEGIKNKVRLRMNYIGKLDHSATYGVACMHGDLECRGNIHQLCVQQHLPPIYTASSPSSQAGDGAGSGSHGLGDEGQEIEWAERNIMRDEREKVEEKKRIIDPSSLEEIEVEDLDSDSDSDGHAETTELSITSPHSSSHSKSNSNPHSTLAPPPARFPHFEFILSQNFLSPQSIGSDSYARKCLSSIGFDWDESGVGACVGAASSGSAFSSKGKVGKGKTGKEGVKLLRESARRTAEVLGKEDRGRVKSCTVYLGGRKRCVHDGGGWYDCDEGHEVADFVRSIEAEWKRIQELD